MGSEGERGREEGGASMTTNEYGLQVSKGRRSDGDEAFEDTHLLWCPL